MSSLLGVPRTNACQNSGPASSPTVRQARPPLLAAGQGDVLIAVADGYGSDAVHAVVTTRKAQPPQADDWHLIQARTGGPRPRATGLPPPKTRAWPPPRRRAPGGCHTPVKGLCAGISALAIAHMRDANPSFPWEHLVQIAWPIMHLSTGSQSAQNHVSQSAHDSTTRQSSQQKPF